MWAWTEDKIEAMRGLIQQGMSSSQIARAIGAPSKNSVVSKVHRLNKFDPTIALVRRTKKKTINHAKKKKQPSEGLFCIKKWKGDDKQFELPLDPNAPVSKNISLIDLEKEHCRFPHGDGKNITFCGHTKKKGSSYCAYHANLCEVKL